MTDVLYRWPSAAQVGSVIPKTKFYEYGSVSTAVREKFVTEVQRITWAYKLAESTVNLAGNAEVPEIQVFQLEAKGDDISESVLTAIDKAVRTSIVFELIRIDGHVRMTAALKLVGRSAQLGVYYTTSWLPKDSERQQLPGAITLPALYTTLVQSLSTVTPRPGEDPPAAAARMELVRRLEREISSLQKKLRNEPQLNRKVEIRRILKTKQAELEQQR